MLGGFSHGLRAVATEVSATIEANHLNRVVHAANANVAHVWVLECLSLAHLPTSSIVRLESRPVDTEDDAVRTSVDAVLVRPSWNPGHWSSTDVDSAAVSSHIVSDVVVAQLQQATTGRQDTVSRQQFPVAGLLINDVRSFNRRGELAKIHRVDCLLDEIASADAGVRERSVSPLRVLGAGNATNAVRCPPDRLGSIETFRSVVLSDSVIGRGDPPK